MSDAYMTYTIDSEGKGIRVPEAEARASALALLDAIEPDKVTSYYTGRPGCACGCRGTYRYPAAYAESEGQRRGYPVGSEEVTTLRSVRSIITRLRTRLEDECFIIDSFYPLDDTVTIHGTTWQTGGLSVEVGERVYSIFTQHRQSQEAA